MQIRSASLASSVFAIGLLLATQRASAANIDWKGYTWTVTNGGMAGVAAGSPANVAVDSNGYLHLKVQKNGDTWTAAEIFSTAKLGFGTYQWQIEGPIDTLDKNIVLGLFPYGPAAGIGDDGTNEIDIEYSRWGQENGPNGDWTNYPASGKTIGERSYSFSLAGNPLSTSRFIWTSSSIEDFLLAGFEPLSSTKSVIETWKYAPDNPKTNIPQQALPLGMNLWCYAIPSDGKNVEVIVRDFQFLPEGASAAGSGGAGGSNSSGGTAAVGGGAGPASGGTGTASGGASAGPEGTGGASTSFAGADASAGTAQAEAAAGRPGKSSKDSAGCSLSRARFSTSDPLWLLALFALRLARRTKQRTEPS